VFALTDEARRENALALAAAAGLPLALAAERLEISVLISHEPDVAWAAQLASEAAQMLSRTVREVVLARPGSVVGRPVAVELVIAGAAPRSSATPVFVSLNADLGVIARSRAPSAGSAEVPGLWVSMLACYACAGALYAALGDVLPYAFPEPFVLRFGDVGVDRALLQQPLNIGRAYMAGAGAVGNAVLWAARHTDLRGEIVIADDDSVDSGNLNRQVWFGPDDLGQPKATRLAALAQPFLPGVKLIPETCRIQNLPQKTDGAWLTRLLVTVDSRRARRALQTEFPGEVFDASTTDIREVVSCHNRQPTDVACLSCVYEPDAEEYSREHHIAEHLGVSVSEVRAERISEGAAHVISARFRELEAVALVGMSYDTLFKKLCAEAELQTVEGRRVVAPFAFVSCLAGVVLMMDLVRRLAGSSSTALDGEFNYWRLSAWHPPLVRRRERRGRQSGCGFCGNPTFATVNRALWGDHDSREPRGSG
jgi:hypothetical protein